MWRCRELLLVLITRDLKILYRQAIFGITWALIQPLLAVAVFTIVFGRIVKLPSENVPYFIFALSGLVPWIYFSEAVRRCTTGLVNDSEMIRKVYLPRLIIPLSGVISPIVELVIGLILLVCLCAVNGILPSWRLVAVPFLLLLTAALALSVGLWLGPVNVRFRDVKHTLPFMLQIWMYASPIVYSTSVVPEGWRWAFHLNPVVGVIEAFRWAVLGSANPDPTPLMFSVASTLAALAGGLVFFRSAERVFADVI